MNNEWKIATLEQCKRLFELGVELETEKVWVNVEDAVWILQESAGNGTYVKGQIYPAPDVAELGSVLPEIVRGPYDANYNLSMEKEACERWWVVYEACGDRTNWLAQTHYKTEAKARCAALIWLIESKTCVWDQETQQLRAA